MQVAHFVCFTPLKGAAASASLALTAARFQVLHNDDIFLPILGNVSFVCLFVFPVESIAKKSNRSFCCFVLLFLFYSCFIVC